jgi:hypothetical protein
MRDREFRYALTALKGADRAVSLWVGAVSAEVEQTMGVTSRDPRLRDDPAYAAAIEIAGLVQDAVTKMRAAGGLS